jgi:heavy metal efflux system protein
VKVEKITGLPVLTAKIDRPRVSRYGLNVAEVQEVVEVAVGGKATGQVFEGDRRFDLLVRLPERLREDMRHSSACRSRCGPTARTAMQRRAASPLEKCRSSMSHRAPTR